MAPITIGLRNNFVRAARSTLCRPAMPGSFRTASQSSMEPPPPASAAHGKSSSSDQGFTCGGFFFALDPNIGLWNDRVNPNWRLLFTNRQTLEKLRVPYGFAIQQRGPHIEFAVRLQFGFVQCDDPLAAIPEKFEVESGWEASVPLPFFGLRMCRTVIRANILGEKDASAVTIWCIDCPIGFTAGFQQVVSGIGRKGDSELTWRNEVAMAAFVVAAMYWIYNLVTLKDTWLDAYYDLLRSDEDVDTELTFDAIDMDGDGFISLQDLRAFLNSDGEARGIGIGAADADALFAILDTQGTGMVSYEQFAAFLEASRDMLEQDSGAHMQQPAHNHSGNVPMPDYMKMMMPPSSLSQSIVDANSFGGRRGGGGGGGSTW